MSLGAGAAAGCRFCVRLGPLLCAGAVTAGAAGKVFLLSGVYAGVISIHLFGITSRSRSAMWCGALRAKQSQFMKWLPGRCGPTREHHMVVHLDFVGWAPVL